MSTIAQNFLSEYCHKPVAHSIDYNLTVGLLRLKCQAFSVVATGGFIFTMPDDSVVTADAFGFSGS